MYRTPRFLAPRHARRVMDVTPETLAKWAKAGRLPAGAVKVLPNGRLRYDVNLILADYPAADISPPLAEASM